MYLPRNPNYYNQHSEGVLGLAWSPGGTRVASVGGKTLHIWNAATCATIATYTHASTIQSVAWSSDSIHVASGGKDGAIYIYKTNKAPSDSSYTTHNIHSADVQAVAWSPDGKLLASASDDGTVRILDPTTGKKLFTHLDYYAAIYTVAWSPDGTRIAVGDAHKLVHVWLTQP